MPCEIEVYKTGDMFERQGAEPVSWSKNCDFELSVLPSTEAAHANKFLPIKNGLEVLLEAAKNFGRGWPLDVLPVVSHGLDAVEAPGHLADVGLHLVVPVVSDDGQGCLGPLVPHAGQRASPHLPNRGENKKSDAGCPSCRFHFETIDPPLLINSTGELAGATLICRSQSMSILSATNRWRWGVGPSFWSSCLPGHCCLHWRAC